MLSLKLNKKVGHIIDVFSSVMCPIFFRRKNIKKANGKDKFNQVRFDLFFSIAEISL